ncbi:PD-(D/E)XK nuclease family protein [Candidatus Woesearchaeota archaeon]|jgi:RecB family exonuclease|nr:PD-(D/E)XK nuclease family protein [Candidatus Woesearchaeota archaeon]MBT6518779.1 PD-(D/E)XK nuclease family protein [Candidatus Woesearchaeota archaeon]MBT7366919.1 PD-(D/E)XK nuclease family protein [Candidatus Woesearchaeota archaeon]
MAIIPKRVQSPSSINLYKQCPRRYFYSYILKYPTKPNIHLIRGNVVHNALEKFFNIELSADDEKIYKLKFTKHLKKLFNDSWTAKKKSLARLGMLNDELQFYYDESMYMLANWLNNFIEKINTDIKENGMDIISAFEKHKPHSIEEEYRDEELMVRGFVDVIHKKGEDVIVVDYKTSKKSTVTPAYQLQLGIYALLYKRKHGVPPKKVGIWFLKDREIHIDVTAEMIKEALFQIEQVHASTQTDVIADYPKKESGLCKYSTGQCDFYEVCMRQRN